MLRRAVEGWVFALVLTAATAISSGQDASTVTLAEPAVDELTVGDGYAIEVDRGGVRQRLVGDLAKANDRWIILRQVSESRTDFETPVLSKLPFVGRHFHNIGIGRQTTYVWIPREAATVAGRVVATNREAIDVPADETPPVGNSCRVDVVADGKIATHEGSLAELSDDQLVIASERCVAIKQSVPYVGDLPFVGALFRRVRTETQYVREPIARDAILCVHVAPAARETAIVELVPDDD